MLAIVAARPRGPCRASAARRAARIELSAKGNGGAPIAAPATMSTIATAESGANRLPPGAARTVEEPIFEATERLRRPNHTAWGAKRQFTLQGVFRIFPLRV